MKPTLPVNMAIERDGEEIQVSVTGLYYPASRGFRDRCGAPEEPDEPESVEEITAFRVDEGEVVELTEEEDEKAQEVILESIASAVAEELAERHYPEGDDYGPY